MSRAGADLGRERAQRQEPVDRRFDRVEAEFGLRSVCCETLVFDAVPGEPAVGEGHPEVGRFEHDGGVWARPRVDGCPGSGIDRGEQLLHADGAELLVGGEREHRSPARPAGAAAAATIAAASPPAMS